MDDGIVKGESVAGVGEKTPTRQSYAHTIDEDTPEASDVRVPEVNPTAPLGGAQLVRFIAWGAACALVAMAPRFCYRIAHLGLPRVGWRPISIDGSLMGSFVLVYLIARWGQYKLTKREVIPAPDGPVPGRWTDLLVYAVAMTLLLLTLVIVAEELMLF
jgi:hypothetical protein